MVLQQFSHIVVMKMGPYCGFSVPAIVKIKSEEERRLGKFFWGYGGVFCRPKTMWPFLIHARLKRATPVVMFALTDSKYVTAEPGKFSQFSRDSNTWRPLPKEVLLVGNTYKPHFAIVCRNLQKADYRLNLADYVAFTGSLPDPNRRLSKYICHRVDKACGYYLPATSTPRYVKIYYTCELAEPHSVYIR